MPNPLDKLFGRDDGSDNKDGKQKESDDGLKDLLADARRRRGVPPNGYSNGSGTMGGSSDDFDEISSFFANHPFFGGRFGGASRSSSSSDSSPSSVFENMMMNATHSSSYQMHQDEKEVTIDVDLPGVSAKELKVEVLQNVQSCIVQWRGQRKQRSQHNQHDQQQQHNYYGRSPSSSTATTAMSFDNRLRLGPQVDCDQLKANLSHGILTMKAPLKDVQQGTTVRSIEVTEHQN